MSEQIPDPELRALVAALEAGEAGRAQVRAYLNERTAPIISGETATFLYLGRPQTQVEVAVTGEWNGWDKAAWLAPAGTSGLYWRVEHLHPAARVEYQFRVNGRVRGDGLNPHEGIRETWGPKSALIMPDYRPAPEVTPRPGVPQGQVTEHMLTSPALGQTRQVLVYTPPGDAPVGGYPVAVFHDGGDYLEKAQARTVLDNSIADGAIPPLLGVFLPPLDRRREYGRQPDPYVQFCASELPIFLRAHYPVASSPQRWVTMGASLGGLISVYLAWRCPQVYGWALPRSGAFSIGGDAIIRMMAATPPVPVGLHCVAGLYELLAWSPIPNSPGDLTAAQRRFVAMLADMGYQHVAAEYPEGHNWTFWAAHIQDGLAWALGGA